MNLLNLFAPTKFLKYKMVFVLLLISACSSIAEKAANKLATNLTMGIVNHDDPETVAEGLPAYLILLDGFIAAKPDNAELLLAGAKLYSAYAAGFVFDSERRKRLADHGFDLALRGTCVRYKNLCALLTGGEFTDFTQNLYAKDQHDAASLYILASSWAGWVQADTNDWARIADLPKIEAVLNRLAEIDSDFDNGNVMAYLGVLDCLRPESTGGNPQRGSERLRDAFNRSGDKNLMPKVLLAEHCARLLFDQEWHDELLNEVLNAETHYPGLTLSNVIAKRKARELLQSGKDFF